MNKRKIDYLHCLYIIGLLFVFVDAVAGSDVNGIYAIWYHKHTDILSLPYVKGGQVFSQWRDIEKEEGVYDFSIIDRQLQIMHEKDLHATVQVNGNLHPQYLFTKVPYLSEVLTGTRDTHGTLMYWHKNYQNAYVKFLKAYAKHLKESPYRASILGVRMNYNAIGTEQSHIKPRYRNANIWVTPTGVEPGLNWSPRIAREYRQYILSEFVELFIPEIKVFIRNNVFMYSQVFVDDAEDPLYERDQAMKQHYLKLIDDGIVWLFHTSSEIQPRNDKGGEQRYLGLRQHCRTGMTKCYAESWTDSDRHHSNYQSVGGVSQEQWLYWRFLSDLNLGISYIAVYYGDLKKEGNVEIRAALDFASKYAGYNARPQDSPGAWIAFREGDYLQGDYDFLMERLPGDQSKPVSSIGSPTRRFGVWARQLDENDAIRLQVNDQYFQSLPGAGAKLRIIYFDKGNAELDVEAFGEHHCITMLGSDQWKEERFDIQAKSPAENLHPTLIKVRAMKGNVILHMVELSRH